jgi:hypothetical protein
MHKKIASLALGLLAPIAAAQCPLDPAIGTLMPYGGFDYEYPIQAIGFAFPFAGTTYTNVHITTKGMFYLSNAGVPPSGGYDYSPTTAELVSGSPRICPMWTDMGIDSTGGVYINSTPTLCTITWKDAHGYGTTTPLFSIQCKLFPTGEVKFSYSAATINNSVWIGPPPGWPAIVGASPGMGATLPAAVDLSLGGVTLDNTVYEEFASPSSFNMGGMDIDMIAISPGWVYSAPPAGCALASNYGQGCLQVDDSYYENFDTAANMDLTAGKTITMIRSGPGYLVLDAIPGTIVPPGGGAVQVAAGDDVTQTVALSGPMPVPGGTTSSLTICSNGHIALSASAANGSSWTPDPTTFLGFTETPVAVWHDYNNTLPGSGIVTFEQVGGFAYVTFNNVFSYGTVLATGDTFQFQFEVATGNITLVFGAMTPDGNGYLVGYSRGGPSPTPTSHDLSAGPFSFNLLDVPIGPGLAITANGLPTLGNAGFAFNTSNVPNLVPLAFVFFGTGPLPGIDLGFLGAPDCRAYQTADLGAYTFPVSLPAGTGSFGLAIPVSPAYIGTYLAAQSVAFSLQNPLNLIFSNGTQITIGN